MYISICNFYNKLFQLYKQNINSWKQIGIPWIYVRKSLSIDKGNEVWHMERQV